MGDGFSESLIKSVKICLQIAVGDSILTFSELQTVLLRLINERPIGTKVCDPNEATYLCSNDLLLVCGFLRCKWMNGVVHD